jgi:hypothetical protein
MRNVTTDNISEKLQPPLTRMKILVLVTSRTSDSGQRTILKLVLWSELNTCINDMLRTVEGKRWEKQVRRFKYFNKTEVFKLWDAPPGGGAVSPLAGGGELFIRGTYLFLMKDDRKIHMYFCKHFV